MKHLNADNRIYTIEEVDGGNFRVTDLMDGFTSTEETEEKAIDDCRGKVREHITAASEQPEAEVLPSIPHNPGADDPDALVEAFLLQVRDLHPVVVHVGGMDADQWTSDDAEGIRTAFLGRLNALIDLLAAQESVASD